MIHRKKWMPQDTHGKTGSQATTVTAFYLSLHYNGPCYSDAPVYVNHKWFIDYKACCYITPRHEVIWASMRESLSSGVCKQQRRRPACTSQQTDQRLCYSPFRNYHI